MPSPVLNRVPGDISRIDFSAFAEMRRIISALPWKPPHASTTASAGNVSARTILFDGKTGNVGVFGDDLARGAAVDETSTPASLAARVSSLTRTGPPPTG